MTITVTRPGHSWITGDKPAAIIAGLRCVFVTHYGTERTVWTYR